MLAALQQFPAGFFALFNRDVEVAVNQNEAEMSDSASGAGEILRVGIFVQGK